MGLVIRQDLGDDICGQTPPGDKRNQSHRDNAAVVNIKSVHARLAVDLFYSMPTH